jgi:hypothetical protein
VLVAKDLGEEGISYVRRYLEANAALGKQLGRLLPETLDLEQGKAWAFVPDPLPDERTAELVDFETGGLFRRHGQAWRREVNAWVSTKAAARPHVLCAESGLANPTDRFVSDLGGRRFFCQDSVFECVELPTDEDVSDRFAGATWSPDIAILTPRPVRPPEDKVVVSPADLAALVGATLAFGNRGLGRRRRRVLGTERFFLAGALLPWATNDTRGATAPVETRGLALAIQAPKLHNGCPKRLPARDRARDNDAARDQTSSFCSIFLSRPRQDSNLRPTA